MAKAKKKTKVDPNAELKLKFIDYYSALPIQKLAADYIGRHENTIIAWKDEDPIFRDQVLNAASQWAKSNSQAVRNREWLLERVMHNHFAPPKQEVDLTVTPTLNVEITTHDNPPSSPKPNLPE